MTSNKNNNNEGRRLGRDKCVYNIFGKEDLMKSLPVSFFLIFGNVNCFFPTPPYLKI